MSEENISANGKPVTKVNFNTAGVDVLTTIPGIGPAMAERIIAARPFGDLSDLQRVSGIGPSLLAQIEPMVTVDSLDEEGEAGEEGTIEVTAEVVEVPLEPEEVGLAVEEPEEALAVEVLEDVEAGEAEEAVEVEAELVEEEIPEAEAAPEPVLEAAEELPELEVTAPAPAPRDRPSPRAVTPAQAFWLAVGSSFLAFILALAVGLGILAALNNGQLIFATPGQITLINRQVDGLISRADVLEGDIGGLRARLDNLETLGGRVDLVEESAAQLEESAARLAEDMATTADQVTALGRQTEAVSEQVDVLQSQSDRFQNFLGSLQQLLNEIFEPEEAP